MRCNLVIKLGSGALLFFLGRLPEAAAATSTTVGVNVEAGLNGNYGILGVEGSYFPSPSVDLHVGTGVDTAFAVAGGGFRLYAKDGDCFLLKHCKDRYFFEATASRSLTTAVTETKDGVERRYKIPRTNFIHAGIGDQTLLFDRLTLMFHLGYKFVPKETKAEQVSGPEDGDGGKGIDAALEAGPQVSVGVGLAI